MATRVYGSEIFSQIKVSGQPNVDADSDIDALTLIAGSNITLTTDATDDKVTIATTGLANQTHTGDATGATALIVVGINNTILSGLATGILKNTTTTGVPSIAVASDFPTLNQNTTGSSASCTGNAANVTGIVAVVNGGTNANTDSGARSNLGAAASGANADITSLTPGTDFTLNQNSVAPFTSVLAGAIANTLVLYQGKLGNGTSTPAQPIDIYLASSPVVQLTSAGGGTFFYGRRSAGTLGSPSNTSVNSNLAILYGWGYGDTAWKGCGYIAIQAGEGTTDATSGGRIIFAVTPTGSTASIEKMRLDIAGNLALGTTTASAQLHTTGTVRMQNFGAGTATFDANGNISSVSDERLKTILGSFNKGLDELLQINPILHKWNETSGLDRENIYAGFSAQNVAKWIPEAASINGDGMLGVSDRVIIAAIVNAVKELSAEVDVLKTKLALSVKHIVTANTNLDNLIKTRMAKPVEIEKPLLEDAYEVVEKEVDEKLMETIQFKKGYYEGVNKKIYRLETQTEAENRRQMIINSIDLT